jgi:hypothetical protein
MDFEGKKITSIKKVSGDELKTKTSMVMMDMEVVLRIVWG